MSTDVNHARHDRGSQVHHFFFSGVPLTPQELNSFRAPEPLPILNPSNFVPQNGFPVVKGLRPLLKTDFGERQRIKKRKKKKNCYTTHYNNRNKTIP